MCSAAAAGPEHAAPWSIAIIASRESPEILGGTLDAVIAAAAGRDAVVDVIVNGNRPLADAMAGKLASLTAPDGVLVRAWFVPFGDKAHAWNVFVHEIYQPGRLAFFLDGYVLPRPHALALLQSTVEQDAAIVAVSGVPESGRTATTVSAELVATQGLHGNLHAIAADALALLRSKQFKLPLGLYRVDGMVGAVLRYRCEPASHDWNSGKIVVEPRVRWLVAEPSALNWAGVRGAFKRRLRQAQGELENRAMRAHMTTRRLPANAMEETAAAFVQRWIRENPAEMRSLRWRKPLTWYAAKKLAQPRDWSLLSGVKELLQSTAV